MPVSFRPPSWQQIRRQYRHGTTALFSNTTGEFNTAIGSQALRDNVTGGSNTAIGDSAGFNITGSGNVCIGAGVHGVAGETSPASAMSMFGSD
jgi:hypothetical protein